MAGRKWTKEEDEILVQKTEEGATCEEIAQMIKRTTRATQHRFAALGLEKPRIGVGDKVNRLTVLQIYQVNEYGQNRTYATCLCDCGKKTELRLTVVQNGEIKSCGCLKKEFLAKKGNQYGLYEDREVALLKVQYSHLKRRNKKMGFKDVIDFETFAILSKSSCKYCGLKYSKEIEDRLNESKKSKRLSDHILKCNGIDRIDSKKGYTKENSVPCCKYCNCAKNTMSKEAFYEWIRRIYEYNFKD